MITVICGGYVKALKNKDTWSKVLRYLKYQIRFNSESIQGVVVVMALYTILENPNGNRNVLYLYRNDDGEWNWNYNWLDNDWNKTNVSAVSPQLSLFLSYF